MSELQIQVLTTISTVPIAYVILKLIFRKSIMFRFSWYVVLFVIFVSFMKYIELINESIHNYLFTALNIAVGTLVFMYVNRILRKQLDVSINQVKMISEGNIDIQVSRTKSEDELGVLNNSICQLTDTFNKILSEMQESISELTRISQELSTSTNQQAASNEEVSSSMQQMVANIQQNAHNASQTEMIANKAAIEIRVGNKSVNETVNSMVKIAENITIIEEIAEKTDLLAINAAIEAARAGEHGKGFAVVAMEIRKLAERSQNAASQINSLSRSSVSVAKETGSKMAEIVPEIEKTSTLVKEISISSQEQNTGAEQVNSALLQLNVTNQNTASNAEAMASQAEKLKGIVSFFKVNQSVA